MENTLDHPMPGRLAPFPIPRRDFSSRLTVLNVDASPCGSTAPTQHLLMDVVETTELVPPAFDSLLRRLRDRIANGGRSPPLAMLQERGLGFVAPFQGHEQLLQTRIGSAPISLADPRLEAFICRHRRAQFTYGYPVYREPSGRLSPLFHCPVTLGLSDRGRLAIDRLPDDAVALNRALLARFGVPGAAAGRMLTEIERNGPRAFADCLSRLCRMIGVEPECIGRPE